MKPEPQSLRIPVGNESVSGLLLRPEDAKALYLFAHGAGAGMTHKAMESNAQVLATRGIATLRYQFLYMEKGSKRPDPPRLAHAAVRAAAAEAVGVACRRCAEDRNTVLCITDVICNIRQADRQDRYRKRRGGRV